MDAPIIPFQTLTRDRVSAEAGAVLAEHAGDGAPLVITFGYYHWVAGPPFQFYGQLSRLERQHGPISKLLLRDPLLSWYHYGIEGLGESVDETVDAIRGIIARMRPSRVITLGQSMGAYAAVLYGTLLGVDHVVAFGTLSCFRSSMMEKMRDHNWKEVIAQVESDPPTPFYDDLVPLVQNSANKPQIDLFYGTMAKTGDQCVETVNLDALHAFRFSHLPNVHLHPVHEAHHGVAWYLHEERLMTPLLSRTIFGS